MFGGARFSDEHTTHILLTILGLGPEQITIPHSLSQDVAHTISSVFSAGYEVMFAVINQLARKCWNSLRYDSSTIGTYRTATSSSALAFRLQFFWHSDQSRESAGLLPTVASTAPVVQLLEGYARCSTSAPQHLLPFRALRSRRLFYRQDSSFYATSSKKPDNMSGIHDHTSSAYTLLPPQQLSSLAISWPCRLPRSRSSILLAPVPLVRARQISKLHSSILAVKLNVTAH